VIVDNGSGGTEVYRLRDHLGPAITILESATNGGYAAGNNLGIRFALERDADYVWILNPDTEVEPKTLHLLMSAMRSQADAGFIGSVNLVGGSKPPKVQFAGGRIDWDAGGSTESIGIGTPAADLRPFEPYEVDYVAGTSMLVRRRVFDDVGLLPEHYFLYFEEADLQLKARSVGWRSYMSPLARVWHYQRSATGLPAPYYVYYYVRGRFLFAAANSDLSRDEIENGLAEFITGWRMRVAERAPDWLETYDRLVESAIADGRSGRTGRREDIDSMTPAGH
jgi:GT2 family glycosyltransferase